MFYGLLVFVLIILFLVLAWWAWGYAGCQENNRKLVPVATDSWGGAGSGWGWGIIFIIFLLILIGIFVWRGQYAAVVVE